MTWDGSKGGSSREQMKEETGKLEFRVGVSYFFWKRKIGRVGGTCGRKPYTLF